MRFAFLTVIIDPVPGTIISAYTIVVYYVISIKCYVVWWGRQDRHVGGKIFRKCVKIPILFLKPSDMISVVVNLFLCILGLALFYK